MSFTKRALDLLSEEEKDAKQKADDLWTIERAIDALSRSCKSTAEFSTYMELINNAMIRSLGFLSELEDEEKDKFMNSIEDQEFRYGEERKPEA